MTSLDRSVRVFVAGAGALGSGIGHVAARAGHTVYLFDQNAEAVARGKAAIGKDLRFLVSKGKLSEADCGAVGDLHRQRARHAGAAHGRQLANEAVDAVLQGVASAADVDTVMGYGVNYPRGPLAWAALLRNLRDHYGEERYRISP